MLDKSRSRFGDREPRKRLAVGTEVWMQDKTPGGKNLWDHKSTVVEVRPSGSYRLVDEDGTEAIRNDKHVKPVYVKKTPAVKANTTWADAVKGTNNKPPTNDVTRACQPCMKSGDKNDLPVDISEKTLNWNTAAEGAAKRVMNGRKKTVSFASVTKIIDGDGKVSLTTGTKTADGNGKMRRRSERLRAKNRNPVRDDEKFVRRIRAKGPMTWGWFTYIPEGDGAGHWYKDLSGDSAVAA